LSYESDVIKPEVRAYQLIAERLGVEPDECIFVDDQEKHCAGASQAGMKPVLYNDFTSFKKELEKILTSVSDN
jgi:putative hydrolase of the HAD superfamily